MRIPLLRPEMPAPGATGRTRVFYRLAEKENHFTNFGPCFDQVVRELKPRGYALPVSSGTAALYLAAAVHLRRGKRVLVPDFTCAATVLALVQAGMFPVICPCDKRSWSLDLEVIKASKDLIYDAIMVVSPFGYDLDFDRYRDFAMANDKRLIFDLAGGWGLDSKVSTEPLCYSFHATKNLSIGEGGMVIFQNGNDWEKARQLSNFGFDASRASQTVLGINAKLDEWHCAMILERIEKQDSIMERILRKRHLICDYLSDLPGTVCPNEGTFGAPSVCVLGGFKDPLTIEHAGAAAGIGFRAYYSPLLSKQPAFSHLKILPECAAVAPTFETCLGLPSDVTPKEYREVVAFLKPFL